MSQSRPPKDFGSHLQVAHEQALEVSRRRTPTKRHDAPSMAYANLIDRNGKKLGKWLFTAHLENQFTIEFASRAARNTSIIRSPCDSSRA